MESTFASSGRIWAPRPRPAADRVLILGTKEKASESWAHNPYIGIVARCDSRGQSALEDAKSEKPMWSAVWIAAFLRDRDDRGFQFDDKLPDGSGPLIRGGLIGETANHGHHAFLGSRSRQCQQPAWGKFQRNPPIMASPLSWTTISPKPATTRAAWENSRGNRQ